MEEVKNHTVWVGGVEVNDYLLTKTEAETLCQGFIDSGYDDAVIEKIKGL